MAASYRYANGLLSEVLKDPEEPTEIQARVDAGLVMAHIISGNHPVAKKLTIDQIDDFALYVGLCLYEQNRAGCSIAIREADHA